MHVPGMTKKQECLRNINLMDIYPTLIDLCKLPKKELDGKSFKPLLQNPMKEWTPAITTSGKGEHSVMSEKWHYIEGRHGTVELYNIEADPMEWVNLSTNTSPEIVSIKKDLKTYIPVNDVDEMPNDTKKGSDKEKVDGRQGPDMTLKATRILSQLK